MSRNAEVLNLIDRYLPSLVHQASKGYLSLPATRPKQDLTFISIQSDGEHISVDMANSEEELNANQSGDSDEFPRVTTPPLVTTPPRVTTPPINQHR